ncbi:putative holin-like toxin [Lactobacillus mellis]|nr:putative holin-like toxin [Bombilactobacillus mellis]
MIGGGRYGVKNHSHNYSKEKSSLVSVKDALPLMLAFGTFTTELIKISKKNNRLYFDR